MGLVSVGAYPSQPDRAVQPAELRAGRDGYPVSAISHGDLDRDRPGDPIYVYFGIFGKGLGNGPSVFDWMLFGLGVLATIALAILVIRKTKTKFAEENPT